MREALLYILSYLILFQLEETSTRRGVEYLALRFIWLGNDEVGFKLGLSHSKDPKIFRRYYKLNKFLYVSLFLCF